MENELKDCPFCGGKAEMDRSATRFEYCTGGPNSVMDYGYEVYCTQCSAGAHAINVPPSSSEEAAGDWNRRYPPLPQPDWSQAPGWARWWAVDPNGFACWFEEEPVLSLTVSYCGWIPRTVNGTVIGATLWDREIDLALGVDWRMLKEQRHGRKGIE